MNSGTNKIFSLSLIILSVLSGFFVISIFILPANNISVEKTQIASIESSLNKQEKELEQLKDFAKEKRKEFILSKTSFVEINLQEMKAKIYKEGILDKEISVLAKGDPYFWGGVPSGLYKVISGYKNAFSSIAEVYMPWSINFYGKYYLHGEPYYPGGQPTEFDFTGGCVRFSDEDAEFIFNATEIAMPVLIIDKENDGYNYGSQKETISGLSSQSWLVADLDSYHILNGENTQEVLPIASLSKLMTALVVVEERDLRRSILVKEEMLNAYGSTKGLLAGERYNLVELLHPLLIQSSNDAAEILSRFLGRKKTLELMNEKAKAIGMENTFYNDPSGLSEKNVSTAQDLFYLGRYIFNVRPPLLKITKGEIIETFGKVSFKDLHNKNIFPESSDFLGGKTGFILESKNTGMFIFQLPLSDGSSRNIIMILLKSDNLKGDVEKILTWWFENYYFND